jgi:hypothetical protein
MLARNVIVAALGVVMVAAAGCSDPTYYPGYCDSTGCYACDSRGCWPVSHPSCGSDQQCAAGETCTDIGCTPACTSDADCTQGEVCDVTSHLCAPAGLRPRPLGPPSIPESCQSDEECQKANPARVCVDSKCIEACTSDADCAAGYVCTECGKCAPAEAPTCGDVTIYCDATVADSCGADRTCLAGRCHVACAGDSACPTGQICQLAVCVNDPSPQSPECVFNADCTGTAVCINGYCHPTCAADTDCGTAEMCNLGVCVPDPRPAK